MDPVTIVVMIPAIVKIDEDSVYVSKDIIVFLRASITSGQACASKKKIRLVSAWVYFDAHNGKLFFQILAQDVFHPHALQRSGSKTRTRLGIAN